MERIMSTRFPATGIDDGTTLPNPAATDKTNNFSHSALHGNTNDAVKAVETKLGTGSSTPANNTFLIGDGAGTSSWSSVTSAQLAARISDETGSGSAVFATTPTLVTPKVDTINESTPANGVTIDGLNIKDSKLNTNDSVVTNNITDGAVTGVKIATYKILRQDDTTNSTENTARMLTGWGVITPGVANFGSETVTFTSAFSSRPIVIITSGGDAAAATTYGSGAINIKDAVIFTAGTITTTNFVASFKVRDASNYAAGNTVFYQWMAFGA